MPVLSTARPTLLDVAKTYGPDGVIATVAEVLQETNEMLEDAVAVQANGVTSHTTTVRAGLPVPTWRMLYGGVQPTKSVYAQVSDTVGMLEDYAEVDAALVELNNNEARFRALEDRGHIQGMAHEMAQTLLYGNELSAPAEFTGLSPRFNDLSAPNGVNIIDAEGTGSDLTSIWLVGWGEQSVHLIYPKGSQAGLRFRDMGEVTVENVDGSSGRAQMYRSHYRWDMGLSVRDWNNVVRIANIDVADLATVDGQKALVKLMIEAEERIPNLGSVRPAWYTSRRMSTALRLGILERVASNLTFENIAGRRVTAFDGIPVRRVDALLNTESQVI